MAPNDPHLLVFTSLCNTLLLNVVGPGACFQSTQYGGIRFQVQVGSITKDCNFCLAFSFTDLLSHFSETSCHVGSCPNSEAIW